jgi:hypothetical protein
MQVDIIKKDMKIRIKDFLVPLIAGIIFICLYYLLPKIHLFFWLIFMFAYGIWFSIVVVKLIESYLGNKFSDKKMLFIAMSMLLYLTTLVYLSKDIEPFITYRRVTFLPFNGILYLIILVVILKIKVRYYDYIFVLIYGTIINISFTDPSDNMFRRLDLFIAIWITCFLFHIIQICKRNMKLGSVK